MTLPGGVIVPVLGVVPDSPMPGRGTQGEYVHFAFVAMHFAIFWFPSGSAGNF